MLAKKDILGVGITDASEEDILKYVIDAAKKDSKKQYIVTPNPEILVYSQPRPSFKDILNSAAIALPDGIGVLMAADLLRKPLKARITGVDFMEKLCAESAKQHVSIGLLGGVDGVAVEVADCLRKKYPGITIVFAQSELNAIDDSQLQSSMYNPLPSRIDILFVAFGHPKQEEWIATHLDTLPVKWAMGVGGAFDYISGRVPRAPFLLRSVGLEWLYRLIRQPWRWRRQLALPKFVLLVLRERWRKDTERRT